MSSPSRKHKITVIGSGNWGSAIAKIVAENAAEHTDVFEKEVQMWVYEEEVTMSTSSRHYDAQNELCTKPQKLTKIINTFHENIKYLPGVTFPTNLIANPSVTDAVKDSSILVFNLPHQFINRICDNLKGHVAPHARAISCIKGVSVSADKISLYSDVIGEKLGIYCGALSGANIATEVGLEKFSETTVAYNQPDIDTNGSQPSGGSGGAAGHPLQPVPREYPALDHALWKKVFHRPYFHVNIVSDVAAVSLAGALKNVVAMAAGFVMGLEWGDNAKAAMMRVGLLEMVRFGHAFFEDHNIKTETFTEESAGVADLITSCNSGRNYRCAKMAIERNVSVKEIERTELNGQLLQGLGTADEVYEFLKARGKEREFPLLTAVYKILHGEARAQDLPQMIEKAPATKL